MDKRLRSPDPLFLIKIHYNGRGVSINLDKNDKFIQQYGGAFEVDKNSIPKGLSLIKTKGTHYEIQPTRPMKEDEFLNLMKKVKLKGHNNI